MKRDDDLLRDLLFRLEAERDFLSAAFTPTLGSSEEERRELGHIHLLADAGFVQRMGKNGDMVRLTNVGHDFLEAVRQDTTWNKTKEIASKTGSATLGMMLDIALALGKQKLKEMTGWEV